MCNNESIQKYNFFIKNNFSEEYYFKDILVTCHEKKLLKDDILNKILFERLEVLKVQLKYYTKDESSSIMVEFVERILQGVDYTIGIYLKTFDNIKSIIDELKNTNLFDMFKSGNDLIKKKVIYSKKLLKRIQEKKLKVDIYSYNDTIDCGVTMFFKEYDSFFMPHETPGSIDYQLYMDNINYKGIEYISKYLENLDLENQFCYNFNISEINELLKGYDKKYELLLINIFELVLSNSLGLIVCGKNLNSLNINKIDREYIKNKLYKLSLEELQETLSKCGDKCCEILAIKNIELINYIKKATFEIASSIDRGIKLNKLETVFISFNRNKDNDIIEYIDGTKLSNTEFRKLSEKIRECSSIQSKIELIKNNIKSLEDLSDMLNAECLFEDEFSIYFKSLSQLEIILLAKHISDFNFSMEYEKEWYIELKKYIQSLSKEERENMEKLQERIELI